MLLHLGSTPTLVISSPNFAEQVLKTHDTTFCTRPRSPGPKRIFYNYSDVVFTPYGDHWRNARKIFVSHLLSTKNDRSFFRAREVEVGNLIDYLSRVGANPVNLDEKIFGLVGGVIGQVAFGKSYKGKQFEGHELKDIMDETMNMVDSFSAGDFFPSFGWIVDYLSGHKGRLDKCFYKLDGYFRMVLEEHRHRETREDDDEDLVDVLIRLSNDEENGVHLSNEQIKAMLMVWYSFTFADVLYYIPHHTYMTIVYSNLHRGVFVSQLTTRLLATGLESEKSLSICL
ncbi:hypothetical protein BUALT_Bualt11G0018300 [Buddleja alternifolia]|uniref:Cytochrome P450 n=1 Tax=Buddleja alternifolia TaxID=168488 RepID=A0AAV6WZ31_9LAMI|nr:hypothetical protein BUALT_Bualt11G0018300 [Buddleja alternifolia]